MFHYIVHSSIFYYLYLTFVSVCTPGKRMFLQGEKGKKKSFQMLMAVEMDEIYINNENSFYSLASDHQCILLRILVAKGIGLKLSSVAGGSD